VILEWDEALLAEAMQLDAADVRAYFTDGRRVSFLLERRIRDALQGWRLAPSEGAGFDLIDKDGGKWEVRSVTKNVYFCPSNMVGKGRKFEEAGFLEKIDDIEGYICSDITQFPRVPVYTIPAELVRALYVDGALGANTSISRKAFYERIVPELD
jgi:hypothetical protein